MTEIATFPHGPYVSESATLTRIETPQDAAIQRLAEWARSADAAFSVAQRLVQSSFVPQQFRGKPIEAAGAILAGIEVGLSPMGALRAFDIINGQAAPKAITQRAVAQSHGHQIVLVESTATRCRVKARRRGDDDWQNVTWTIDRARELGLAGKPNWKSQPIAMLLARATSEAARLVAADALMGIAYSAEELADGVQPFEQAAEQATATPTAPTGTQRVGRRRRTVEPVPDPAPDSDGLDEFHEATSHNPTGPAPSITKAQQTALHAALGDLNLTDRDDKLAFCGEFLDRTVGSSSDISKDEASRLLDHIGELIAARGDSHGDDGTLPGTA